MTSVRGGSKLLHYLLDSHPQVISFPRTFQFDKFWHLIKYQKKSYGSIADTFIKNYPRFSQVDIENIMYSIRQIN